MSEVITTAPGTAIGAPSQRLNHGTILRQALAPFKMRDRWAQPIHLAYGACDLVRSSSSGELLALKGATELQRFEMACDADGILDRLPANEEISAALEQLGSALDVKPTERDYKILAGVLLDGLSIKSRDDGFIPTLTYVLEDVEPDAEEYAARYKPPSWVPVPAFAAAVDHLLRTHRVEYGKPPPIADIINLCRCHRLRLCEFRHQIVVVWNTRQRLTQIGNASAEDGEKFNDDAETTNATATGDDDWGF
jgi:hypothetical protein